MKPTQLLASRIRHLLKQSQVILTMDESGVITGETFVNGHSIYFHRHRHQPCTP